MIWKSKSSLDLANECLEKLKQESFNKELRKYEIKTAVVLLMHSEIFFHIINDYIQETELQVKETKDEGFSIILKEIKRNLLSNEYLNKDKFTFNLEKESDGK